jgi:phospholipase C
LVTVASVLQLSCAPAALSQTVQKVTAQPNVTSDLAPYFNDPAADPKLSTLQMTKLLQNKIKYVFVIFNENRSFDHEYGTFPGARGIYADENGPRSAAGTPGFTQTYTDVNGNSISVQPFLIGPNQNASSIDDVDHSHARVVAGHVLGIQAKVHAVNGVAQMDQFAYEEYNRFALKGGAANIAQGTQQARLVMSHVDCDTVPFFWQWAKNFTLFDNMYATEDTPSTPNAIAMLAGQAGETQWVKHGTQVQTYNSITTTSGVAPIGTTDGVPLTGDPQPFYGSGLDTTTTGKLPLGPVAYENAAGWQINDGGEVYAGYDVSNILTFASLPLTFQGRNITSVLAGNKNPSVDLADIQQDIPHIQGLNGNPVSWRWYQEGYDLEATDTNGVASHNAYVSHHNGAQYFGYIANTPAITQNLRGMTDFFTDIASNTLPNGGVFYIRGGYNNQEQLLPPITEPGISANEIAAIQAGFIGDDDHPEYSDSQITEAMNARVINAIASNPQLWSQSAILITYDESDGFYDHVPPRVMAFGPDSLLLSRGIRVPLILVSPYARTHAVSHAEGDHNAVIQTINAIFGLPALASLPDEAQALAAGNGATFNAFAPAAQAGANFQQQYLGPRDINSAITDSLLSGFDPKRLLGISPPLPASLAQIPANVVTTLPHYAGNGCSAIGMTTTDRQQGITNVVPAGFNPRPDSYPANN